MKIGIGQDRKMKDEKGMEKRRRWKKEEVNLIP
jgi:hypothetical protein